MLTYLSILALKFSFEDQLKTFLGKHTYKYFKTENTSAPSTQQICLSVNLFLSKTLGLIYPDVIFIFLVHFHLSLCLLSSKHSSFSLSLIQDRDEDCSIQYATRNGSSKSTGRTGPFVLQPITPEHIISFPGLVQ